MNRKLAVVILLITLFVMSTFTVFAEGGNVRGDDAAGFANQVQEEEPQGWSWP